MNEAQHLDSLLSPQVFQLTWTSPAQCDHYNENPLASIDLHLARAYMLLV